MAAAAPEIPAGPPHAGPPGGAPPRPQFNIVPRPGLPLVAIVLAGLVTAIAGDWLWGLT